MNLLIIFKLTNQMIFNSLRIITLSLLVLTGLTFSNCGGSSASSDTTEQSDMQAKTGKEYTSAYVCPMHCEGSGSAEPGQCPVCKMDYVANADLQEQEHDHEHDHDHNH